jgi:hypothetical protein
MLSWKAYALFIGAVTANAWLVTSLSHIPALAAFAATLGGTLSGALGFQVLARIGAWAKQTSSAGRKVEKGPFAPELLRVWSQSQVKHCDLTRDGRNIRKDAWLQLQHRLTLAIHLKSPACYTAVADAVVDHVLTFPEVQIDHLLAREFQRIMDLRFDQSDYWLLKGSVNSAAMQHKVDRYHACEILDKITRGCPSMSEKD